jgi:nucleoside-diphosphate-sugar epimerase
MPEALRDFVYVDDVVDALIRAARFRETEFRVFNIGSGQAIRVIDMVHLTEELYGKVASIEVIGPNPEESSAIIADIRRARKELGWTPQYDLAGGLVAMKTALEVSVGYRTLNHVR